MSSGGPLFGKSILVTRPKGQAASFVDRIEAVGGTVHLVPLIAFRSFEDDRKAERLKQLHTYDWIVLTSKNGVDFFFDHLERAGIEWKEIRSRFAVIGPKTEAALKKYGFKAEYIPDKFSADQFVKEISAGRFKTQRVLIPKGNLARAVIAKALREAGMTAEEWIVYETFFPEREKERLIRLLQREKLDVITFTSPSSVRHFMETVQLVSDGSISHSLIACIGPVTKQEAEKLGLRIDICPEVYTTDALVEEMIRYYRKDDHNGSTI
ncbi:uroporphyrinogen-III synthase [Bacillus thermotolerans]|uniref:Uroporphyrinogen-III synthase n=1 Tax=Bacillus thermotolerans TaxID=1221996 RepID=A0A0F5HPE3_BACTR|nr:uroporphyrinogen-III synthase [Bacillus thermotolerans]KKB35108.1 Uroporphyrinogen-III synthase [Bacillus thermotolerans]KKB43392.1 Uroporphyrinogen-III synthase [Bacillus thermotolerans]KKB43487.1 Uroporphyrinogen-III synthase [Bacillus thermotolerans]